MAIEGRVALEVLLADLPSDARPVPEVAAYDDLLPGRAAAAARQDADHAADAATA